MEGYPAVVLIKDAEGRHKRRKKNENGRVSRDIDIAFQGRT